MLNQTDRETGYSNAQSDDVWSMDPLCPAAPFMPSGETYSQMKGRVLAALEQVEMGIEALERS